MLKGAFNLFIANYLKYRYSRWENMYTHADTYQRNIMQRLAIRGSYTDYGKLHDFKYIRSYKDFQKAVPITAYDDLKPYFAKMMEGQADVLWPGNISWFAKSSGTTSDKSKYIPISDEFLTNNLIASSWDTTTIMYHIRPQCLSFERKNVTMCGSLSKLAEYPKAHIGDVSAIMVHRMPNVGRPFFTPDIDTILMSDWDAKIEKMARAVIDQDVVMFGGVPTWTIVLFERILELTGKDNMLEVWPNVKTYLHGGVGFDPYIQVFNKYLPTADFDYVEVYNASEGCFAIHDKSKQIDGMSLLVNNDIFYEFIPISEFNDLSDEPIPLWDVETGKSYALCITTSSGLWRYQPGDTVTFTSTRPYMIKVTGRTKHFINVFGEEVMVSNTDQALALTCEKHDCCTVEYTVGPKWMSGSQKGGHEWYIEFEKRPKDLPTFEKDLDKQLQQLNSDYEAKRYQSIALSNLNITEVTKGGFLTWLASKGKLGAQNKVPRLSNDRKILEELALYTKHKTQISA